MASKARESTKKIISRAFAIESLAVEEIPEDDPDFQIFLKNAKYCILREKIVLPAECIECWEKNFASNVENDLKFKRHKSVYLRDVPDSMETEAKLYVMEYLRKDKLAEFLKFHEEEDD